MSLATSADGAQTDIPGASPPAPISNSRLSSPAPLIASTALMIKLRITCQLDPIAVCQD
jgi:hypothetical protein